MFPQKKCHQFGVCQIVWTPFASAQLAKNTSTIININWTADSMVIFSWTLTISTSQDRLLHRTGICLWIPVVPEIGILSGLLLLPGMRWFHLCVHGVHVPIVKNSRRASWFDSFPWGCWEICTQVWWSCRRSVSGVWRSVWDNDDLFHQRIAGLICSAPLGLGLFGVWGFWNFWNWRLRFPGAPALLHLTIATIVTPSLGPFGPTGHSLAAWPWVIPWFLSPLPRVRPPFAIAMIHLPLLSGLQDGFGIARCLMTLKQLAVCIIDLRGCLKMGT